MATSNEIILDEFVAHQIGVMRFSDSEARRLIKLLDESEPALKAILYDALEGMGDKAFTKANLRRLASLRRQILELRGGAVAGINETITVTWEDFSKMEGRETPPSIIKAALPVKVGFNLPPVALLKALVSSLPYEGRLIDEWFKSLTDSELQRIMDQVKLGMVAGESNQAIVRRVTGTVAAKGADGATGITRNNLAAIVRTITNGISNEARSQFALENADIIRRELYVATLDRRTTPICRALDGQTFETGKGPMPPVHVNCRSTRVPLVTPEPLGNRPYISATESQLKGKSQAERRRIINSLTGTTPATENYNQFLGKQTVKFQDEVLGKTRAKLFREGGLSVDKFVNYNTNKQFTLEELRRREPRAFKDAGLD